MHTLEQSADGSYKVYFYETDKIKTIETGLSKFDALALVNYLNGGIGHQFGQMPDIRSHEGDN